MMEALHVLNHTFGFSSFRAQQADIVDAAISGKNTLVVMPTGGGKSLCYQIPALVREGMGIVVSPLIALMQDQVSALSAHGLNAAFLNSTLPLSAMQELERRILVGDIDILYVAPERLIQARTINLLQQVQLSLFAIDEAHCLAQWGHDFRSDYLRLDMLPQAFPNVPRVALTATADRKTQGEIARCLQLDSDAQFVCGFDRSNIQYRIQQKNRPKKQLLSFLQEEQNNSAGIVYCLSRKKVDDTALWLQHEGFNALPYHAGMDAQSRQRNQDRFLREDGIIIVATIAFGMGIDKPNVRFVAHLDMPKSIEAYYQETGRAGRDGEDATALLFYGMEDVVKLSQMAANSEGSEEFKRHERQRLNAMLGLCEMTSCRRQALLHYFDDMMDSPCGNCDNCIQPPQTRDATEDVRKALSCVYRTGQRFGAVHVIDVLRGSDNEKVRQFSHQTLSTYAIGKELSTDVWRSIFRQLIVMGFLEVDVSAYGNLRLTEKSRPVLRGEQSVHLRHETKTSGTKRNQKMRDDIDDENRALWNDLRACRKQLAQTNGVPPYIIFNDATLKEMLIHRPLSSAELIKVNGVGDKKLEQFGDIFLDIIRNHEYV